MDKYSGNDNHGKPRSLYLKKLAQMTKEELFKETKDKIWLSAYANNNPRSDFHWQVDACYDEWVKRDGNPQNYEKAYNELYNEFFR
jgi:hypothetical protein